MGRKYFKAGTKFSFLKENSGMTLSEIIVVVAILGLLIVLAVMTLNPKLQMGKARDSRRKADLQRINIALEDYAGDNPCYPTAIYKSVNGCVASDEINPYLNKVPCDPSTTAHYDYRSPITGDCKKFVVYASLETPQTTTYGTYNYALASPNLRTIPTALSPTGGPAEPGSIYGCINGYCAQVFDCTGVTFENKTSCSMNQDCTKNCCCSVSGETNECEKPQNECYE